MGSSHSAMPVKTAIDPNHLLYDQGFVEGLGLDRLPRAGGGEARRGHNAGAVPPIPPVTKATRPSRELPSASWPLIGQRFGPSGAL